jgi:hypothetical protein
MSLAHVEQIDHDAVLKTLNLNPQDPNTQALLLICERYRLDPLLKHLVLIQGRPYVTRDGYLTIAHASGEFDGIEIVEEGEDSEVWWARAAVYRKDMSRPFVYRGRYPKKGGNKQYGPEMAVKCAEVMAMRRAFGVTGVGAADERWDVDTHERIDPGVGADLAERINALGADSRKAFLDRFGYRPQDLRADYQEEALEFTVALEDEAEQAEADATTAAAAAGELPAGDPDPEQPELPEIKDENGTKAVHDVYRERQAKQEAAE